MRHFKLVLLGSAAALTGIAFALGARAADLPQRQAAPIEYIRICDAYGASFFYIPGTETCLQVGGMALAELRSFDPSFSIVGPLFYGNGAPHLGAGFVPLPSQYSNARSRDATDFAALGRVELDARTQSPFGTLRSFIRVNSFYGSNGSAALGSLGSQATTFNTTAGTSASRETTLVSRAFVQFVGLTAGRTQSMFDFYADAINFKSLRGSNAIVTLFAYTATLGNGFSGTVSFEDQPDRRAAIGSTIASTTAAPIIVGGISATSFQAQPAGSRVPEIIGNLRFDQPWGAVQLSAAAHQVRASLFGSTALATPPIVPTAYAFPALISNSYGFALQGGLLLDADYISQDDRLWLQVAYEKGALGYIAGNNLAYSYGSVNQNRFPGSGFTPLDYAEGWNSQINSDCVFTGSGSCEQQWGWDITGAYRHYWIPNWSSGLYGSYMEVHYPADALAAFGGAVGVSNLKEGRVGTNLIWTPIKNFDVGAEFMYVHLNQTRPAGLAPDAVLTATGLPAFRPNFSQYEGRLRVQRAF